MTSHQTERYIKLNALQKKKKYYSADEALKKLEHYCAYQDRCHAEVRTKLIEMSIYGDDLEEIISSLIGDNFLNEERFAQSFARGKFRMKKWGKVRIRRELKFRKISDYCLRKAMKEIPDDEYIETLQQVLLKKSKTIREENDFKRKVKLTKYVQSRGFEVELILAEIKELKL